jgi:hypothetical protein
MRRCDKPSSSVWIDSGEAIASTSVESLSPQSRAEATQAHLERQIRRPNA